MSGMESLVGLEKLTLHQCEDLAKKVGFDNATFDLCSPLKVLKCKWIDAYFGFFSIVGLEGVYMSRDLKYSNEIWCENLMPNADVKEEKTAAVVFKKTKSGYAVKLKGAGGGGGK